MTGMPTRVLDLHTAATDDSETPATAFAGTGLGAGLNQIIADAQGTGIKVGPGSSAPARGKTLVGNGLADAGSNQESIWDRFSRKNIVLNPNWTVTDQGTAPTATDNTYVGGNWRILLEAANACTIARETSDLPTSGARSAWKLIVGSAVNNKFGLFQAFEGADIWDLRAAVASLQSAIKLGGTAGHSKAKAAICVWTGTEDAVSGDPVSAWGADGVNPTLAAGWAYVGTPVDLAATTSWATYYPTENGAISGSATNLAVFVWNDSKANEVQTTDYVLVTDVQLERGAVCTAVERRKSSEEWALDSWYGEVWGLEGNANSYLGPVGYGTSGTTANLIGVFPKKRAVPTVTISAATDFACANAAAANALSALSANGITTQSAEFGVTGTTITSGQGQALYQLLAAARLKILIRI